MTEQAGAEAAPSIAPQTGMGAVHIAVTDGDRATRFYRDYVGLRELASPPGEIRMGAAGRDLVVLHPGAAGPVMPHTTGLYHLAIVVPDKRELARVVARLGGLRWDQSPTDHVMTKADYLWDPDGNGIEVYAETPEDGTMGFANGDFVAVDSHGRQRSGRDPIDLRDLLGHLAEDDDLNAPMPEGTKMGHVHLHVADVDDALRFYHDLVGFDVMGVAHSAAFISAGGYHHHLGLNTWAGQGAPPPPPGAAGLRHFTIELPRTRDLEDVVSRLERAGAGLTEIEGGFATMDPSANQVRLAVAPQA